VIEMYMMFGTRYSDGLKYRNVSWCVCFKLVSVTGAVQVHCAGCISIYQASYVVLHTCCSAICRFILVFRMYCHVAS